MTAPRDYPQGPLWPLPSQNGVQGPQQHVHSNSVLARSGSVSNGLTDARRSSQWNPLPQASTAPISSQGQRSGSDGLDALANAAVNRWQPSSASNGEQPTPNSGWTGSDMMQSPQQNLDQEQKQALSVIARGLAEKTIANRKRKMLTETIIEALNVAVSSALDDNGYDQSDGGDVQSAAGMEEMTEIQDRLERVLARLLGNDLQKQRASMSQQKPNGTTTGERCPVCDKQLPRNCELK